MSAQTDLHYSIDRAANAVTDATCTCRAMGARGLPQPHRRLIDSAIRKLTGAQDDLYQARHDPYRQPPAPAQLELL